MSVNWVIVIMSIVGVVLNIKKIRACFILWCITNAWWCVHNFSIGEYAQSSLFFIYFVLAIVGLVEWTGARREMSIKNNTEKNSRVLPTGDGIAGRAKLEQSVSLNFEKGLSCSSNGNKDSLGEKGKKL